MGAERKSAIMWDIIEMPVVLQSGKLSNSLKQRVSLQKREEKEEFLLEKELAY